MNANSKNIEGGAYEILSPGMGAHPELDKQTNQT
jgi:hypothetical protein